MNSSSIIAVMGACPPRHTHAAARETGTFEDCFDGALISVPALLLPPECIAAESPSYRSTLPHGHLLAPFFALKPEKKKKKATQHPKHLAAS